MDQKALIEALDRRHIAGAAIDVFETHPVSPTNTLLDLDNVIFTPHIGGATEETGKGAIPPQPGGRVPQHPGGRNPAARGDDGTAQRVAPDV